MNLRDLKKLGANSRRNLVVVRDTKPRVTEYAEAHGDGPTVTRTVEVGDGAAAICPSCSACVSVNGERAMRLVKTRGARIRCGECRESMIAKFDWAAGGRP